MPKPFSAIPFSFGADSESPFKKMKKTSTIERTPAGKAGPLARTVDEYLASVPEPARTTLSRIRAAIVSALPHDAVETISYRIPAYKYKGLLVGFAAFTAHCTFATMSPPVIEAFKEELSRYDTADSIVRFPHDKPLPAALVRKIVKARIVENRTGRKW
jgi:uncharacterized protein YdhG (YjbR/CyaY superfamily)